MASQKKVEEEKSFKKELVNQMLTLATSGFGLVAALAWNEAVQTFVKEYINKFFPSQSGALSKFLYAVIITAFAVFITYQLSRISARLGSKK